MLNTHQQITITEFYRIFTITQTVIDRDYLQRAVELITWLTLNHCINLWLTYQCELLYWPVIQSKLLSYCIPTVEFPT